MYYKWKQKGENLTPHKGERGKLEDNCRGKKGKIVRGGKDVTKNKEGGKENQFNITRWKGGRHGDETQAEEKY